MPDRITVQPAADQDIDDHFAHLVAESPMSALRFLEATAGTFDFLFNHPGIGRTWDGVNPALEGLRSFPVRDFSNWLVFYRPTPDGIEVLRDLHGARDLPRTLDPQG